MSGGTFRPLKFAKYLHEFGFRPHIYNLHSDYYAEANFESKRDFTLVDELNGKDVVLKPVKIGSVKSLYRSRLSRFWNIYFNVYRGSEYKKWEVYLMQQIEEDSRHTDFKAVFVTAPPFGMLRLARRVADKLKLPLVTDMRDAWALWNTVPFGSIIHYLVTKKKEAYYFEKAQKIIATTQQTIEDWLELHPLLQRGKFVCIPNGFDDPLDELNFEPFVSPPVAVNKKFTITYVGSFYYFPEVRQEMLTAFYKRKGLDVLHYFPRRQDWLYRTPYFFFAAFKRMLDTYPDISKNVQVVFAGHTPEWLMPMISDFQLDEFVEHRGFLSHHASLKLQHEADALLVTSAKLTGGKDCFVAGKTFEYFTMQKPILSFVAEGAQKDILVPSGLAVVCDPDDVEVAAETLYHLIVKGKAFIPDEAYLRQFNRKALTKKLAETLKEVIERRETAS